MKSLHPSGENGKKLEPAAAPDVPTFPPLWQWALPLPPSSSSSSPPPPSLTSPHAHLHPPSFTHLTPSPIAAARHHIDAASFTSLTASSWFATLTVEVASPRPLRESPFAPSGCRWPPPASTRSFTRQRRVSTRHHPVTTTKNHHNHTPQDLHTFTAFRTTPPSTVHPLKSTVLPGRLHALPVLEPRIRVYVTRDSEVRRPLPNSARTSAISISTLLHVVFRHLAL